MVENIFGIDFEDVIHQAFQYDTFSYEDSDPDLIEANIQNSMFDMMYITEKLTSYENTLLVLEAAKKVKVAKKGIKPKKKLKKKKKVTREGYVVEVEGDIDGIEGIDYDLVYEDPEIDNIVSMEGEIWDKIREGIRSLVEAIIKFIESIMNFLSGAGFKSNVALAREVKDSINKFNSNTIDNKQIVLTKFPEDNINLFKKLTNNIEFTFTGGTDVMNVINNHFSNYGNITNSSADSIEKEINNAFTNAEKVIKPYIEVGNKDEDKEKIKEKTLDKDLIVAAADFIISNDGLKRSLDDKKRYFKDLLNKTESEIKDSKASDDDKKARFKVLRRAVDVSRKLISYGWNFYRKVLSNALKIVREAKRTFKR